MIFLGFMRFLLEKWEFWGGEDQEIGENKRPGRKVRSNENLEK